MIQKIKASIPPVARPQGRGAFFFFAAKKPPVKWAMMEETVARGDVSLSGSEENIHIRDEIMQQMIAVDIPASTPDRMD